MFGNRLIQDLGLDWFGILVGKKALHDASLPYPTTFAEIRDGFGNLEDEAKLTDALEHCTALLKREEDRSDKVESKAIILIGTTGIATGFITGFAGLLLDREKIPVTLVLTWIHG